MKSVLSSNFLIYLILITLLTLLKFNSCEKLRGVTVPNWPYVERFEDSKSGEFIYDGYAIDLIKKISETLNFEYDLNYPKDMNYGKVDSTGRMNGIVGEVYNARADFAIADLSVTDERKKHVDFTEPFMKSVLSALIHKSNVGSIETFSDLVDQTDIEYGLIRDSNAYRYFRDSQTPIIRKMYKKMSTNPKAFVNSRIDGINRVNNSNYAFISYSASLEFMANVYCDLIVINDTMQEFNDFNYDFAIALRRHSKHLNPFNEALNTLRINGYLDELKNKYWNNKCDDNQLDINSVLTIHKTNNYLAFLLLILFLVKYYLKLI